MAQPYNVAVHLTAVNGVSGVLAAVSREALGLHGTVEQLNRGFSNLRLGVIGAASAMAGAGLLKAMGGMIDKGNEWVRVSNNMRQAGVSSADTIRAQAEAMRLTAQYTNMSSVEIMKMQNDARQTFGTQAVATEHIKDIVEAGAFLKSYEGKEKGGQHADGLLRELNAALKSGELAGKITPEEMTEHIRQLTAMKVAYGDQVKITQYLAAQRTAGVALRSSSDEFRYGMFPALVQEQQQNAGTMLMTAFNKIVAGVGNRTQSIQKMAEMGLLNEDQIKYDKAGRAIGLKDPSAIKDNMAAAVNFGNWVETTLKPLLEQQTHGLTGSEKTVRESQLISQMFPDRNAAKAVTEILQQFSKLSKDAHNMVEARKALEDMRKYMDNSWDFQVESFKTQWDNFITHLGAPMVLDATHMLRELNKAMAGMAQWAMANPEIAKAFGETITALGAGLFAAGTVAIITAIGSALGPTGFVIGGLVAFATQLDKLTGLSWKQIAQNIDGFWKDIAKKAGPAFAEISKQAKSLFAAWSPLVKLVWGDMIKAAAPLRDLFSGLAKVDGQGIAYWAYVFIELLKALPEGLAALYKAIQGWIAGEAPSGAMSYSGGGLSPGNTPDTWGRTKTLGEIPGVVGGTGDAVGMAGSMLGKHEIPNNAEIQEYLRTGGHNMNPAKRAWCAAFVGASLHKAGLPSLNTNIATDYMRFGSPATGGVQRNDVVVIPRGHAPGQTGGHVGLATGRVHNGMVEVISGNSSNRVMREWESMNRTVIRRPVTAPPPPPPSAKDKQSSIHHIYLDGRRIATAMSNAIARGNTHVRGSSGFDGRAHPTPVDLNYQTA